MATEETPFRVYTALVGELYLIGLFAGMLRRLLDKILYYRRSRRRSAPTIC